MANDLEPQKSRKSLPASSAPQPEEQRERIGVRVGSILGQFWRDEDTPEAMQVLELEGWMDVLEPLTEDEIRRAWVEYQRTGPRTARGALRRPDAGALYRIAMTWRAELTANERILRDRAEREAERAEEAERAAHRISPERALEILQSVTAKHSVGGAQ